VPGVDAHDERVLAAAEDVPRRVWVGGELVRPAPVLRQAVRGAALPRRRQHRQPHLPVARARHDVRIVALV